ncbi:MAG TPA: hypothetical protein VHR66_04220 [Gemmataceae bacterium]|nr:hypothetical protein [Gemmataceae bacterium]
MSIIQKLDGNGESWWAVHSSYKRIGRWENRSKKRDRQCVVELSIGRRNCPISRAGHVPGIIEATSTLFIVDTGCNTTLINGFVASWLGFVGNGSKMHVRTAGDQVLTVTEGVVPILLGGKWADVPCITRIPIDVRDVRPSLLGMKSMLGLHLLCVTGEEVVLFRNFDENGKSHEIGEF